MKNILALIILLLINKLVFSQTISGNTFNAPAQVGNNNTQNNYTRPRLNEAQEKQLLDTIKTRQLRFNSDSCCVVIENTQNSNGEILFQVSDYLKSKGLKISNATAIYSSPVRYFYIHPDLHHHDNYIHISVGSF